MTRDRVSRYEFSTRRVRFDVAGAPCVGRLVLPDRDRRPPLVVLAPGVGLVRAAGVDDVAERFAARGYAAFAFDYRGWGESRDAATDPGPRLVSPSRQRADLDAAVEAAADDPRVNGSRVALWGVDLSAAHALSVAAENRRVDAVVARAPASGDRLGPSELRPRLRGLARGARDALLSRVGRSRSVPLFGPAGEPAVVAVDGTERAVRSLLPPGSTWENATPARSLLALRGHGLEATFDRVRCPTLFVAGEDDALAPPEAVEAASERVRDGSYVRLPTGHYESFTGEDRSRVIAHELAFLDGEL